MTNPTDRLTADAVDALAALFDITFTDDERMWLTHEDALLGPIERQRRHVLRLELIPRRCPACYQMICARGCELPEKDERGRDQHACSRCHIRLQHVIPLFGPDPYFDILPGQLVPFPIGEPPSELATGIHVTNWMKTQRKGA